MKILMDKKILLSINCGINRQPFIAVADFWEEQTFFRRTSKMMLLHSYPAPLYGVHPAQLPSEFFVEHTFAAASWRGCPWCGARSFNTGSLFWRCHICTGLNCAGHDAAGRYTCACGFVVSSFGRPGPLFVRGAEAQQLATAAMQLTAVAVWRG